MDAFFAPLQVFVLHPERIALVSGLFAAAAFIVNRGGGTGGNWLYLAATAWLVFALWELGIVLLTPEANIRIDLLLIFPLLFIISIVAIVQAVRLRGG